MLITLKTSHQSFEKTSDSSKSNKGAIVRKLTYDVLNSLIKASYCILFFICVVNTLLLNIKNS